MCVTNADIINYLHSQFSMPLEEHFLDYVNDVISISDLICNDSKKYFKYRLYHTNYNRSTWGIKQKFIDKGIEDYLDKSQMSFYDRISECRLAIIVYGQNTTLYETLSANFPTLIFWNPDHWELRADAKPYFELLIRAGIYHTSVQSLCNKINRVYEDVDGWWSSEEIQKNIKIFCNQYAMTSDNYTVQWTEELKKHIT